MIVPAPYDRLIDPARVPLPAGLREGPAAKPAEVARSATPATAPTSTRGEWRRLIAHYWGLCSLVDAQVGRIVAYLEREGLLELHAGGVHRRPRGHDGGRTACWRRATPCTTSRPCGCPW